MGKLISLPLLAERQTDGRRMVGRRIAVETRGEVYTVNEGFITDYSSIPYVGLVVGLIIYAMFFTHIPELYRPLIFASLLLAPAYSKVDVAGVIHDFLYASGVVSKWEADLIWLDLAKSGEHKANLLQAYSCWFFGLVIGGWPAWYKHRLKNGFPARR